MSNLIGQSLGRYHILEQLGEGGMAIVYKAYDTRLESDVAVKVIRTERLAPEILQRAMKRFEREAKSLAQLTHPNLVKVLDYGDYEGQPYLVMPYLMGGTLKQKMKGQPMQWQEAARLLIPIARALDYAHKRNLIHRDVKPSNILITESGEPMLTDFGVAKIIDEEATLDLTGTSAAVGTPEYMAPEQATSKNLDHRADIYALGIVYYEMATGRRPFQADTPLAVLFKHASEPLPRPTQFVSNLPDGVEKILVKALSKRPEDRYQSAGEMVHAMELLLSGVVPVVKSQAETVRPQPEPVKPKASPTREKTRDTLTTVDQTDTKATVNLNEEATAEEKSTVGVQKPVSKVVKKPEKGGILRYWPVAVGGIVVCIFLVSALPILLNMGQNTSNPISAEKPLQTIFNANGEDLLSYIKKRGYVVAATDPNYMPQSGVNPSGIRPLNTKCPSDVLTYEEMQGFDVDVAYEVANRLGVEICFATPDWVTVTAGNWADKWDMSVGSMTIKPPRSDFLYFSTPYYAYAAAIGISADSTITSVDQLAGQSVCVAEATTYLDWLNNALDLNPVDVYMTAPKDVTIIEMFTDQECPKALTAGNLDFVAYVTSTTVLEANISAGLPVKQLGGIVFIEKNAIAIDKASEFDTSAFLKAVDDAIKAMHIDGTLRALSIQWFGSDLTMDLMP